MALQATFALGHCRLVQLSPLTLLALQLQLPAELLESLRADPPEMPQLEVDHRVGRGQRIRQQPLEAFELLLGANDRALLLLELVEQLVALAPQRPQLALHACAIPVQLQQLLGG